MKLLQRHWKEAPKSERSSNRKIQENTKSKFPGSPREYRQCNYCFTQSLPRHQKQTKQKETILLEKYLTNHDNTYITRLRIH